jgi:hypothetical protein
MNSNKMLVKMIFDRWYALIKRVDAVLESITDE